MKVILGLLCFVAASILTVGKARGQDLAVGVSLPLTGPASTYGTDIKNILIFMQKRFPSAGISFVFEDDKCDPKEAVSIAQRFTAVERYKIVTGLPCSGTVLAAAPIYERAGTVAISAGAGAPAISGSGDFIFRARPSDIEASKLLAEYLKKKTESLVLIAEESELPQGLADAFVQAASGTALRITRDSFPLNATDLSTIIVRAQKAAPQAVLFFTQTERSALSFVEAYRRLKIPIPLFSAVFPGSPSFLSVARQSANGIIYATLHSRERLNAESKALLADFEKDFGPLNSVDYLFPVSLAAFRAIELCGRASDIKKCLYEKRFPGAEAEFVFDRNGDLVGMGYSLKRIDDGKSVDVQE